MTKVCVCISTHDRPEGLRVLLEALLPQLKECDAALVIVDNGKNEASAVASAALGSFAFTYLRLNEPGLVASRNKALAAAVQTNAPFIAFIDDDEVPDDGWLRNLLQRLTEAAADLCFGPLRPTYDVVPPRWAEEGRFFWKSGKTYGTGNVLIRASALPKSTKDWFQPAFAFLGGEDEELFARLVQGGATVVVADNAWVSEHVPASRLKLSYILSTGRRDGAIEVALMRQRGLTSTALWTRALTHMVKKLGFAFYHLGLLWQGSWHAVAAIRDVAEIAGSIRALFGARGTYYGKR